MVCRDGKSHKAHPVSSLIVETEEEKALHALGEGSAFVGSVRSIL